MNLKEACEIKGWQTIPEMEWLAEHASGHNTIVEVGTYYGRSARCILDNSNAVLYCVDTWNGPVFDDNNKQIYNVNDYVYARFLENMKGYIESKRVVPIKGTIDKFYQLYHPKKVDMIFIDGDHRYFQVKKDIETAKLLINSGGIICGHDYHPLWPGVIKAVNEAFPKVNVMHSVWYYYV